MFPEYFYMWSLWDSDQKCESIVSVECIISHVMDSAYGLLVTEWQHICDAMCQLNLHQSKLSHKSACFCGAEASSVKEQETYMRYFFNVVHTHVICYVCTDKVTQQLDDCTENNGHMQIT